MKNFLKKIEFRYQDIILLISLGLSLFIFIESSNLFRIINPITSISPFWLPTTAFIMMIIGFISYFIIENRYKPIHIDKILTIILFILMITGTIAIFIEPETFTIGITNKINPMYPSGAVIDVTTYLYLEPKFIFFYGWINNLLLAGVALFIIPHRFKTLYIVKILLWGMLIFVSVNFIYSLCTEYNNYLEILKRLFLIEKDISGIEQFGIKGFMSHRNGYATMFEICITVGLIVLGYTRKKRYIFPIVFTYILLLFTICKTAILIISIAFIIYLIWLAIIMIKNKNKKGKIILTITILVVSIIAILLSVLVAINSSFRNVIANFFINSNTFISRTYIWENTLTILGPTGWIIGRGFGDFNVILHNANIVSSIDDTSYAHSFIFSSLGRGGVIALLLIIFLITFIVNYNIKLYKKNKYLILATIIAAFVLILRGLMEDDHYYHLFILLTMLLLVKKNEPKIESIRQID